jgi:hypothetical protein
MLLVVVIVLRKVLCILGFEIWVFLVDFIEVLFSNKSWLVFKWLELC